MREERRTGRNDVRRRRRRYGRFTLENDDAVCKVCGHDEIVLDDEGGLLGVEDEPKNLP